MKDSVKSDQAAALSGEALPLNAYSFGPFRLDVEKRRLWRGDQLVPLTRKAFDTLLALVERAGQVVDKDDLLQIVWPDTFITEETLTQNIATIRRALADSSGRPEYIATIPRRGYRFIGLVTTRSPGGPRVATTESSQIDPTRHADQVAPPGRRTHLLIRGAVACAILSIGFGIAYYGRARPSERAAASEWHINPPSGTTLRSGGVLSPDARSIAFVTIDEWGTTALWVQRLASLDQLRLPGTERARAPIWSPDSNAIVFTAAGKLKRIDLSDKMPRTLADATVPHFQDHGGAWNSGNLLCSMNEWGPIYTSKPDGTFEVCTRLEAWERAHLWPSFLPDGRHFLYRAPAFDPERSGTYVGSLDAPDERMRLEGVSSAAVYAPPGYLLFVREGALVAQAFDTKRHLKGTPITIAADVAPPHQEFGLPFSASGNVISYLSGAGRNRLAWFDRHGLFLGALDETDGWSHPALSPDGAQVLGVRPRMDVGNEIWIAPTTSGTPARLDTGLPQGALAAWSHDGQRIVFTSAGNLYVITASGGKAELMMKAPGLERPLRVQDWSSDDRFLLYYVPGPNTNADLWWLSMADHKTEPFVNSRASESQGQFSPDVNSIAYTSDETGRYEVYVQQFPEKRWKLKISSTGGAQPQWRQDGRELFYLSTENDLMSVAVHPGFPSRFGPPQKLFHIALNDSLTDRRNNYVVSPDGTRFLFSVPSPDSTPITVRLNWTAALYK